jgi:hypothetical protein
MASPEVSSLLSTRTKPNLTTLPPEIHLLISHYLTYPDALSLKHTNQHFYNLVYTGVNLKIEWLIERKTLHLECPGEEGCELGSDLRFCRGSFGLLMKRRREHGECDAREGGRGCLVFGKPICEFKKRERGRLMAAKRMRRGLIEGNVVFWWIFVALVGVAVGMGWREVRGRRSEGGVDS